MSHFFRCQGFPTLKLFGSDRQKNPYTGEYSKEAMDYNGPRTAKVLGIIFKNVVDCMLGVMAGADVQYVLDAGLCCLILVLVLCPHQSPVIFQHGRIILFSSPFDIPLDCYVILLRTAMFCKLGKLFCSFLER